MSERRLDIWRDVRPGRHGMVFYNCRNPWHQHHTSRDAAACAKASAASMRAYPFKYPIDAGDGT